MTTPSAETADSMVLDSIGRAPIPELVVGARVFRSNR